MDVEVAEDAAGRRDVFLGRRRRIVRRGTDDEDAPDRAGRDRVARGTMARVEAALEPDLYEDPGARDVLDDAVDRREVEPDRLFAERRYAALSREPQERGVARRRRRDHERVDAALDERLGALGCTGAELAREPARAVVVGIGQAQRGDAVEREQRLSVEGADPPHSDQADVQRRSHFRAA